MVIFPHRVIDETVFHKPGHGRSTAGHGADFLRKSPVMHRPFHFFGRGYIGLNLMTIKQFRSLPPLYTHGSGDKKRHSALNWQKLSGEQPDAYLGTNSVGDSICENIPNPIYTERKFAHPGRLTA